MVESQDLESFFKELKECYSKEGAAFVWDWEEITSVSKDARMFVYFIAYNLAHNVLHGPLPDYLHSRMVFENNRWTKEYFSYLG
jgi:hypothetical protein